MRFDTRLLISAGSIFSMVDIINSSGVIEATDLSLSISSSKTSGMKDSLANDLSIG